MSASPGRIVVQRQDGVCTVTLDNPTKRNAMTRSMWRELRSVFEGLQTETELRCVVLRGTEGQFCAGGDIAEYPSFRFNEDELTQFHELEVWGALSAILACDIPVLAAIEGACMGAGVEIAACCDLRLADTQARFGAPIGRLGFPMAPREAALLAQELGATVVRAMLLAAEIYSADALWQLGFVAQLAESGKLADTLALTTARVLELGPQAARQNKQILRRLCQPQSFQQKQGIYQFAQAWEHREGIMAFLEKRRPDF